MSSPSVLHEIDRVFVAMVEEFAMSMDEWLAAVRGVEPMVLSVPTARLLAEARGESE